MVKVFFDRVPIGHIFLVESSKVNCLCIKIADKYPMGKNGFHPTNAVWLVNGHSMSFGKDVPVTLLPDSFISEVYEITTMDATSIDYNNHLRSFPWLADRLKELGITLVRRNNEDV